MTGIFPASQPFAVLISAGHSLPPFCSFKYANIKPSQASGTICFTTFGQLQDTVSQILMCSFTQREKGQKAIQGTWDKKKEMRLWPTIIGQDGNFSSRKRRDLFKVIGTRKITYYELYDRHITQIDIHSARGREPSSMTKILFSVSKVRGSVPVKPQPKWF